MFNDNAGMYFLVSLPCKFSGNLGVTLLLPNGTGTWHCVFLFAEPGQISRQGCDNFSSVYLHLCMHM